jgi:hypothetical protein
MLHPEQFKINPSQRLSDYLAEHYDRHVNESTGRVTYTVKKKD